MPRGSTPRATREQRMNTLEAAEPSVVKSVAVVVVSMMLVAIVVWVGIAIGLIVTLAL